MTSFYDTDKSGYSVNVDKETLEDARSYGRGRDQAFNREYGQKVYGHYGRAY
jgi:hypothetical protein